MSITRHRSLLPSVTLAAAVADRVSEVFEFDPLGVRSVSMQARFVRAAGGTTCDVFVQTSLDGGTTWIDIAQFAFLITTATEVSVCQRGIAVAAALTPVDGTLADGTILDGVIGDRLRVKYTTTGTYSGASSLAVDAVIA